MRWNPSGESTISVATTSQTCRVEDSRRVTDLGLENTHKPFYEHGYDDGDEFGQADTGLAQAFFAAGLAHLLFDKILGHFKYRDRNHPSVPSRSTIPKVRSARTSNISMMLSYA